MSSPTWKIGELAALAGLSVRTLHHYEAIGLLVASERTEAGHRQYLEADLSRLQRILLLRQLGFALDDIQACLDRPEYELAPLVALHLARLETELAQKRRVHEHLSALQRRLQAGEAVTVPHLIESLEAYAMLEQYLTPEQVRAVQTSHEPAADGSGADLPERWLAVKAAVRAHMEAGDDPTSPPMLALARTWRELVHESTRGDAALARSLKVMYEERPEARERVGIDTPLWDYVSRALAVAPGDHGW